MHWRFEKRRTKLYMGKKIYAMLLIAIAIMIGVYIYKYSSETTQIYNIVKENEERDKTAVDGFIKELDDIFEKYKKNVHHAVEIKPKWRALWERLKGNKEKASQLFSEHFNKEIFGKENSSLSSIVNRLEYDLECNKNALSLEAGLLLKNSGNSETIVETVSKALEAQFEEIFKNSTTDSVNNLVVATVSSLVVEELTRMAVTYGITLIFTTGGGTAGTSIGPVGTAVGVCVGFTAGCFIDWYMEKKNNEKLENAIIEALENAKIKIKSDMRDKLYSKVENLNNKYCDEIKKIR